MDRNVKGQSPANSGVPAAMELSARVLRQSRLVVASIMVLREAAMAPCYPIEKLAAKGGPYGNAARTGTHIGRANV